MTREYAEQGNGGRRPEKRVQVEAATLTLVGANVDLKASVPLWLHWFVICREQTELARKHATAGDSLRERRAGLVAVTASAHALVGIDGSIAGLVGPVGGSSYHEITFQRLTHGFSVGKKQRAWHPEFEWLFEIRGEGAHHKNALREPVAHPELPNVSVPVEASHYSAKSAERARALLEDVVDTCLANPKPATKEWAVQARESLRLAT